jgi:hypothetical protein
MRLAEHTVLTSTMSARTTDVIVGSQRDRRRPYDSGVLMNEAIPTGAFQDERMNESAPAPPAGNIVAHDNSSASWPGDQRSV